jgi:hypothetical protein
MDISKSETRKIKHRALCWLRLKKKCPFIATEVGGFNADVVGVTEKDLVEIEVKVSIEDLKADLRKEKHRYYNNETTFISHSAPWIPTHMYYAVSADLVDKTVELFEQRKLVNYGIINGENFQVVKNAKRLHKKQPCQSVKFKIALRMGSELIRFHEAWI